MFVLKAGTKRDALERFFFLLGKGLPSLSSQFGDMARENFAAQYCGQCLSLDFCPDFRLDGKLEVRVGGFRFLEVGGCFGFGGLGLLARFAGGG